MLQISNAAMHLLRDVLEADDTRDEMFRLVMADDDLALMKVATPEEGDLIYEEQGVAILAAPPDLADGMQGKLIDVEQSEVGTRLVVLTQ
jgi:hypothetical protein